MLHFACLVQIWKLAQKSRSCHLNNNVVSDDDQCDLEELTSFLEASDSEDEAAVPETAGLSLPFLLEASDSEDEAAVPETAGLSLPFLLEASDSEDEAAVPETAGLSLPFLWRPLIVRMRQQFLKQQVCLYHFSGGL